MQDRRLLLIVAVLSFALFLFVGMVSFGVNTSCTDAWSCSSSNCAPCRVVSVATIGALVIGALLGAGAILSPWPRRGRAAMYVLAMVVTAVLALVVAQTWGPPRP
jgi:hypothetical protein